MDFKVGDWVKGYSQGIWRIEKIIKDFYEIRHTLKEPKRKSNRTIFVLKRLVNDNWKRSFSSETCELAFIQKLTTEELKTLKEFISNNEKVMKDFEKYQKNIDLIMNVGFSIDDNGIINFNSTTDSLFNDTIRNGLTSDEIYHIIRNSSMAEYLHKTPKNKTLQFVSINHEVKNSEFIFKEFCILNF